MNIDVEIRAAESDPEKLEDGYVAYPIGLKGTVVGEGDMYEEALADVRSAIAFHIETFGGSCPAGSIPAQPGEELPGR